MRSDSFAGVAKPSSGALWTGRRAETPRRVLYLMDCFEGRSRGGTEAQFAQLVAHLDRRRYAPSFAVFRPTAALQEMDDLQCPVHVMGILKLRHPGLLRQLLALARFVRANDFRLVHIFLNDAALVAPLFCRLGGARVIVSRRDMGFWYTRAMLPFLRASNLFVDRMIANSEAVKRNAHAHERYPLDRIDVIHNGFDPGRTAAPALPGLRERLGIDPSAPVVGMVAHFHEWKRHADLVRAFAIARARHPRAHLIMVGSGSPAAALRELAQSLGCGPAVHFLGTVGDAVPIVQHFSVAVLCSEHEGLSNAIIEYMACGKPTVCTRVGGNVELIEEGATGFFIEPADVPALAQHITHLLDHPDLTRDMGQRARLAAARLTSRAMADTHMRQYDGLLDPADLQAAPAIA
jgi:L-malate glycosyltransferase